MVEDGQVLSETMCSPLFGPLHRRHASGRPLHANGHHSEKYAALRRGAGDKPVDEQELGPANRR